MSLAIRKQILDELALGRLLDLHLSPYKEEVLNKVPRRSGNLLACDVQASSLEEALAVFGASQDVNDPPLVLSLQHSPQPTIVPSPPVLTLSDDEGEVPPLILKGDASLQEILTYPDESIVHRKFGIDFRVHDLKTLTGQCWLNDQVVNSYLTLLKIHFESVGGVKINTIDSQFYSTLCGHPEIVASWYQKSNLFDSNIILVSINLNNAHWGLCVVFVDLKEIIYYDSLHEGNYTIPTKVLDYLQAYYQAKTQENFPRSLWQVESAADLAKQKKL